MHVTGMSHYEAAAAAAVHPRAPLTAPGSKTGADPAARQLLCTCR
jgi:hypothetical protein